MSRDTTPLEGQLKNFISDGTPPEIIARYESLPERAQRSDFGRFDNNVVVLDTETTGFSLVHDELTQIAAARVENGEIVDWFVTFVNPGKPIPEDVAHLTDIHDEDVADAPSASEALADLAAFIGDAVVVAHNAEFDRNFTTKHPTGYPLLENTWIDSLDLSRIALPRMKSHRLIDLVKAFGAPRSTHRADEDVAATCALLRILLAAVETMPTMLLREIASMAEPNDWPTVVVFKYFAERAEKMVTVCQELVGYLEDIEGAAVIQREIASIAMEMKEIIQNVEVICTQCPERYVYAASLSRKTDRPQNKLEALLVSVGETLNETLYARTHSVVYASATLTVDGSFNSFSQAMGLNESEFSVADELLLASSYDFDNQMVVYVVNDMPEPNDPSYLGALQRLLIDAHRAQNGSMLTLFTNRREMEKCFEEVQPALKGDDLRVVCQKWGVSVKGLRDDFLADEHLSLFALKSFWEGFDAPGATLKGVVIPKLPFSKPTDPLSCERAARDDAAWRRYVLPAAVLETKQAAGRLIRKADDRGILILADKRLITKGYGKTFLRSLPSQNIRFLSAAQIVDEIAARR